MVAVSFDGKFYVDTLDKGETVDSERYCAFLNCMHHSFSRRRELPGMKW